MIAHSPTFEDLATAPVKQIDVIVARQVLDAYGYVDDVTSIWTSSDDLMEVKIDAVGTMLGAATKKATIKLLGIQDEAQGGSLYQVRLGIYNQDPSVSGFSYISEGFFLVEEVDFDYEGNSTTITMYDHMWSAEKLQYTEAIPSNSLTYPITVQELAEHVSGILNLTLDPNFNTLPNYNYSILEDIYSAISSATLKNVIQDIAGATGTTARVTDTTLVFSRYTVSSENLDSNTLKTLKIGETYGPVTSVVLGRVPQNDNIAVFAAAPTNSIISSVNTTTNVLTANSHGMADGNMISLGTTGTMPAPLVAGRQYYAYVNGDANTFRLAPTYLDAKTGTNLIDITTTGTGTLAISPIITKEIQINNNEILDDERQALLPPLYNTLSGIDWTDVKSDTVGLGWHEVGDVIQFTQGITTVRAFLSEVHMTFAGSIKEQLISTTPTVASINYQAAGGVMKTLYNTEIKVDKQNQTITSIASRQDTIEGQVNEDLTRISQDVDDVLITVQKSGGGNIILNSVGYAKEQAQDDDGVTYARLVSWDYPATYAIADHGTVTAYDSAESQNYGGISGHVIQMSTDYLAPETVTIKQRVNVAVGVPLSFGMRVYSQLSKGGAVITLSNDNDTFTFTVDDTSSHTWEEFSIVNFVTTQPWLDVEIAATAEVFRFTDLRLIYGTTLQGWVQSNSEILAANVQFSKDGMRIFDGSHDTETKVTYNEFSTRRRSDGKILFEADDVGVVTNDISIGGTTTYYDKNGAALFKQITIPDGNSLSGIAWVRVI